MFNRENWVGVVLVGLCGVSAIALLIEIFTDYTFEYSGPQWLARIIAVGGTVLVLAMSFGALKRRFGRGDRSWPHDDPPGRMNRPRTNSMPARREPPKTDLESETEEREK